jgi:hypothetical protein
MKVTPTTTSDYVKEVVKGVKNNESAGTDNLQAECLKYGGNEIKKKTKRRKLWPNCEREQKDHQNGRKGLSVNCVGKERKWIV